MAQHGFPIGGHGNGGIDPNELGMSGNYQQSFQNNYLGGHNSNAFSSGSAVFGDDELLEGLASPTEPSNGLAGHGQDFSSINDMNMSYSQGVYGSSHHGMPIDVNAFSSTPDGDPIQSPFVHTFGQYRQMQHPQGFGGSLQSPLSFAGSPMANSDLNDGSDPNFLNAKARARIPPPMQRKGSSARSPMPTKNPALGGLIINPDVSFGAQPIRTTGTHHEKTHSGQWMQTPNSLSSFQGSYNSPMQPSNLHSAQINDMLLKGGSMPAKLGGNSAALTPQDAKRKRRRESHNLVERRRRDNINERIQDLSKLVPGHRLEDEKVRKAINSGAPLSPTLAAVASPSSQATSALAGPGARRAAGGTAGNITTGLPIEEKDKGPNKGDILNGAVSWTRDLMWLLQRKIEQQEELINTLADNNIKAPFEITDDEQRMQSELIDAMHRIEDSSGKLTYSRYAGSGLRVPHHTDYRGDAVGSGTGGHQSHPALTPLSQGHEYDDLITVDDDYADGDMDFKEEHGYGAMDLSR